MERLRALMRITAVRLSAVYLLVFAVFAVVLVFYVTATASGVLVSQSRTTIEDETDELAEIYDRTGIVGLVKSIDRRSRQPGASLYLVTDATGRIIAGNVQNLQPGILDETGFTDKIFAYERFAEDVNERYHVAVAQVFNLPNGMRILVGRDQTEQERFRKVVRNALILALALMGVGALAAWFFVGRSALQRLDRMSAASARILAGDLTERLPVTGARDEFDRLSANLNTLLARIALLQEGLRQVSDNIAHDLKTPLTRLRNRAEAALVAGPEEFEPRQALESTITEADQMIRIFDALLMIGRVEAGSHPAHRVEADLAEIVAEVFDLYEPLVEDAGATLLCEAAGPLTAPVSRELIAQALFNLIDNAMKYGRVEERPLVIRLTLALEGDIARLTVADNGRGIPAEKHDRVLERFFRLDESRSLPGSGLGLSLVQAIARLHGGRIALADADPGLIVTLEIPLTTGPEKHDGRSGIA